MPYKPGDWYVRCDICYKKRYRSECVKTWNGLIVCRDTCYDGPRSPLDYKSGAKPEKSYVRDARPGGPIKPTIIETVAVNTITDTTAKSGGNITNDGGASVTAYGVCWATSPGPDTDDDKTSDGTGTAEFTSNLTGLTASTKYFVRAYATNSVGTSYGPTVDFTTAA